jgi:hypothetical protein
MSLHLSAMQAMAEYSGYAGVFCVNTAHGLENENLDRPCRGKVPAGPAPQDARYPQSRRLRFRLRQSAEGCTRSPIPRTEDTPDQRASLRSFAGSSRNRKYCIAILAPRFRGRVDPLPRLDEFFIVLRGFEVPRPFPRGPC